MGQQAGRLTAFLLLVTNLEHSRRRINSLVVWLQLIRNLAVRDVEIRYKHSLLGMYWAIINPLITAAVYSFVFHYIFRASSGSVPYVVFLLAGLTFWNFFSNGVFSATTSITGSAALLAKVYFPRVVLPTAAILARLIDLAFSAVVLAVFIGIYRVPLHWTGIFILIILPMQTVFTLGVGYLVAALNVLYRDVNQLVGLFLMVWMYLSPVMYAPFGSGLSSGRLSIILLLNPIGSFLQADRDLLFVGHVTDWAFVWSAALWTVFVFLGGLATFKRVEPVFAEVM